jgi:hypothetical protein
MMNDRADAEDSNEVTTESSTLSSVCITIHTVLHLHPHILNFEESKETLTNKYDVTK